MWRRIALGVTMLAGQTLMAQEIVFNQKAALAQVYQKAVEADGLLPMNDLNVDFGYVLYQTEITTQAESEDLELENVRDYAAVYVDEKFQGRVTDSNKKIAIKTTPGKVLATNLCGKHRQNYLRSRNYRQLERFIWRSHFRWK
ncbi:hypothetical protein [Pedobacter sp. SL55]|uniref:hypothetical protein n=1 Tax=Pedobacter sp. SL55 TaxID=2995161 RepID=UPI00226F580D|nr:hypothetical protein [Pedobacter sp. SL55]WAC39558.1 hypothetical protein OVA16_13300 [Pedobacter sp. SL55]